MVHGRLKAVAMGRAAHLHHHAQVSVGVKVRTVVDATAVEVSEIARLADAIAKRAKAQRALASMAPQSVSAFFRRGKRPSRIKACTAVVDTVSRWFHRSRSSYYNGLTSPGTQPPYADTHQ